METPFLETQADKIKAKLRSLGFDSTDYADGDHLHVILTASGINKANEKHPFIQHTGLRVCSSGGSLVTVRLASKPGKKKGRTNRKGKRR
jgi:hypothetical protein